MSAINDYSKNINYPDKIKVKNVENSKDKAGLNAANPCYINPGSITPPVESELLQAYYAVNSCSFKNPISKKYFEEIIPKYQPDKISKQREDIPEEAFFIRMRGYDKKLLWAEKMVDLTYAAANSIQNGDSFEKILKTIEEGVQEINGNKYYGEKRRCPGHFRLSSFSRGMEYYKRFAKFFKAIPYEYTLQARSNEEYSDALTATIWLNNDYELSIRYGWNVNNKGKNLKLAQKEFEKLRATKNPSDEEILHSCAIIQWLIAQESPYERGSDSIANVLTKAILKSYGMEISAPKEGISFDFEAFFTDLDEYIEKYPDLFEIPPHSKK